MEILIGLIIFIIFSVLFTVGIIPPGFVWLLIILLILGLFIDLRQKEKRDDRWININKKVLSVVVLVSLLANAYLYNNLYQAKQFNETATEQHLEMYMASFKYFTHHMERVLEDADDEVSYYRMILNAEYLRDNRPIPFYGYYEYSNSRELSYSIHKASTQILHVLYTYLYDRDFENLAQEEIN